MRALSDICNVEKSSVTVLARTKTGASLRPVCECMCVCVGEVGFLYRVPLKESAQMRKPRLMILNFQ